MVGDNPFDYGQVAFTIAGRLSPAMHLFRRADVPFLWQSVLGGAITVLRCIVNEPSYYRSRDGTVKRLGFLKTGVNSVKHDKNMLNEATRRGIETDDEQPPEDAGDEEEAVPSGRLSRSHFVGHRPTSIHDSLNRPPSSVHGDEALNGEGDEDHGSSGSGRSRHSVRTRRARLEAAEPRPADSARRSTASRHSPTPRSDMSGTDTSLSETPSVVRGRRRNRSRPQPELESSAARARAWLGRHPSVRASSNSTGSTASSGRQADSPLLPSDESLHRGGASLHSGSRQSRSRL